MLDISEDFKRCDKASATCSDSGGYAHLMPKGISETTIHSSKPKFPHVVCEKGAGQSWSAWSGMQSPALEGIEAIRGN